ncbi:TetR/AcrR family transcriptional regulator [Shimazuella sp. AN120528]|uniref:TetR/AcrR family transcriptional regulator n=1 Tax=Shimazuella soli TaxID=1892854 RepID=UPI001F0CF514|nr:TetR/AcrR family transcriptional regulator [Shimazuella soli]MCH5585237.1 TetR/AcrR family transcriptional regulator [Shimazuella soli]
MPRLAKEQLEQIHKERKIQIAQAATKVFAKHGIAGTKMSMISQAAGISHGLLYHYFNSKDELFTSLVKSAIETSTTEIQKLIEWTGGTPLEKIKLLTESIIDEDGAPFFQLLHIARNSKDVPDEVKELLTNYSLDFYIKQLFPLFKEGQENGQMVEGDTAELIAAYFTVLSGVMVLGDGYPLPRPELLLRILIKP